MAARKEIPDAVLSQIEKLGDQYLGHPTVDKRSVPFAIEYLETQLENEGQTACFWQDIVNAARQERIFNWDMKRDIFDKCNAKKIDHSQLSRTDFDKFYSAELRRRLNSETQNHNRKGKIRKEAKDWTQPVLRKESRNFSGSYMLPAEHAKVNLVPDDYHRYAEKDAEKGEKKMAAQYRIGDVVESDDGDGAQVIVLNKNNDAVAVVSIEDRGNSGRVEAEGQIDEATIKMAVESYLRQRGFKGSYEFEMIYTVHTTITVNGLTPAEALAKIRGEAAPEVVESSESSEDTSSTEDATPTVVAAGDDDWLEDDLS
jgi:hypothetical protein